MVAADTEMARSSALGGLKAWLLRVEQTPNMEEVPPGVPDGSKRIKSDLLQELQRFDEA